MFAKQKHIFISLGAACDIAMNLQKIGLRYKSYPFDWLWNLYSGLEFVNLSFELDFKNLLERDNYVIKKHYRFEENVCVYKTNNQVAHLHSNPCINESDHITLTKRIGRFIHDLNSDSVKHFIYYRSYHEDIISGKNNTLVSSLNNLISEGKDLIKIINLRYPQNKGAFNLLLILQVEQNLTEEALKLINNLNIESNNIDLKVMIPRDDNNLNLKRKWESQFAKIILLKKNIPLIIKIKVCVFNFKNEIYHRLKKIFLCKD